MTGDAFARFRADLDAAVSRGRRAAAEAAERGEGFERETTDLAAKVKAGQSRPQPGDLTPRDVRRAAEGFRTDTGLPVEDLPEGDALLAPPVVQPTQRAPRVPAPSSRSTQDGDDDEDFSQERIMEY
jgi:hypothetical protein